MQMMATNQRPMHCRRCGYRLDFNAARECPECGRAFDPTSPATFDTSPSAIRRRRHLRRFFVVVGLGIMTLAVGLYEFKWTVAQPHQFLLETNIETNWTTEADPTQRGKASLMKLNQIVNSPRFLQDLQQGLSHRAVVQTWTTRNVEISIGNPAVDFGSVDAGAKIQLLFHVEAPVEVRHRRSLFGSGGFRMMHEPLEQDLADFLRDWFADKDSLADVDLERYGIHTDLPPEDAG